MRNGIHIVNLIKKHKQVYVAVLILTLYSIWVHIESSKYKMIGINSPKSSWFAIIFTKKTQKTLTMLYLAFKTKKSERKKSLRWDSNPQSLGLESFKQLRNTMRKKTAEHFFNLLCLYTEYHHYNACNSNMIYILCSWFVWNSSCFWCACLFNTWFHPTRISQCRETY